MAGLTFDFRFRRILLAFASVGFVATAGVAARATTIEYQFDNFTATGPWATYGYSETLYWFSQNAAAPSFQLNTSTNVVSTYNFAVTSEFGNTNNYNGPDLTLSYDPVTFTIDYQGPYNHYYLQFSADLDTPGPATLVSVNVPNAGSGLSVFSTAVTGGLSVVAVSDVPEPMSAALLSVGLIGAGALRRKRKASGCPASIAASSELPA